MKFKKIMLITFILLAILTIGAASAADDVASDDIAVVEGGDAVVADPEDGGGDEPEGPEIDPDGEEEPPEEIWINDWGNISQEDDSVVNVKAKNGTGYSLQIVQQAENEEDVDIELSTIELNGDFENKQAWDEDDSFTVYDIRLKDVNFVGVNDGDKIVFKLSGVDCFEVSEAIYHNDEGTITFEGYPELWVSGEDIENDDDVVVNVKVYNGTEATLIISSGENTILEVDLKNIEIKELDDNPRYTIYTVTRGMLKLENIEDEDSVKFELVDNDENVIAERNCIIYIDEDGVISFTDYDDSGDDEGDAIPLEGVEFYNANAADDDVVIIIPKEALPDDVEDEFTVTINDFEEIDLSLNDITYDGDCYFIKVSDLYDVSEVEEMCDSLRVEFYANGETYSTEDEVLIYCSPFFTDETSLLYPDVIFTFIGDFPEDFDDEFNVTITKEGSQPIVKTFKISELHCSNVDDVADDDAMPRYDIGLKELGIEEIGNYNILINFTKDGEEFKTYSNGVEIHLVDIFERVNIEEIDGPDGEPEWIIVPFKNVGDTVFYIRMSQEYTDYYVKIYVNGTQVGENIPISDLEYYDHWGSGHDSRLIILNDFNITESGNYTLKVEFYDLENNLLADHSNTVEVEVGDTEVNFNDGQYTCDVFDYIEIIPSAPVSAGDYFNIYLNGELAGNYTPLTKDWAIDDKFYDIFDDISEHAKFLKAGNYDVNITLVDHNGVESEIKTGQFSVLKLNLTSDKDAYLEGEDILISFNWDGDPEGYLNVFYITGWGEMGADDRRILDEVPAEELFEDGVITINANSEYYNFGANYIMVEYLIPCGDEDDEICYVGLIKVNLVKDLALTISIADITEGQNAEIKITTDASFSGNVSVKIGNSNYNVSVVNGTGSAPVSGLAVGTYNAVATFAATDVFKASEKNTTFTVKPKVATAITASAVTTTYATSKNIVVTLKDANGNVLAGKAVTVSLNGVSKTLTTNAKGQVSYAIGTKLVPKKYTASIRFAGDSTYLASTGSVKVTVNKAKAKMTAKKKAFKAKKKTKKYTIVLKTNKNKALAKVKVTLKIKGKKYTAKTNAKGKATFKIKKLTKKGKYKATVTFAGNKYYNKLTKKVKITVK